MPLLDQLLSFVAPHSCLNCGRQGLLLCQACALSLPPAVQRCYRCQRQSLNNLTCRTCLGVSPLLQVRSVTVYDDAAKQLVGQLKFHGAVAAVKPMSRLMNQLIIGQPLIVPVPTSNARRRQRSYDQAELLARQLARFSGLPYARLLARHGERHQIGASRQQRQQQLQNTFRVRQPHLVRGPILLIDDVVTTGATLEAAAQALYAVGLCELRAVTFAQA